MSTSFHTGRVDLFLKTMEASLPMVSIVIVWYVHITLIPSNNYSCHYHPIQYFFLSLSSRPIFFHIILIPSTNFLNTTIFMFIIFTIILLSDTSFLPTLFHYPRLCIVRWHDHQHAAFYPPVDEMERLGTRVQERLNKIDAQQIIKFAQDFLENPEDVAVRTEMF